MIAVIVFGIGVLAAVLSIPTLALMVDATRRRQTWPTPRPAVKGAADDPGSESDRPAVDVGCSLAPEDCRSPLATCDRRTAGMAPSERDFRRTAALHWTPQPGVAACSPDAPGRLPDRLTRRAAVCRLIGTDRSIGAATRTSLLTLVTMYCAASPAQVPVDDPGRLEQNLLQAQQARIEQSIVAPCVDDISALTTQGQATASGCAACTEEHKRQHIAELYALRDAALQECRQKGRAAQQDFLRQEERRLQGEIAKVRSRIEADKQAFRRLGIATVSDAFDTWGDLTAGQLFELKKSAFVGALSATVEIFNLGAHRIVSLTPQQARRWADWLESVGVSEPTLIDAVKRLATDPVRAKASTVRAFAEGLQKAVETGHVLASADEGQLEALPALLGMLLKTPDAKGAVALGQFLVSYTFAEMALGVLQPDVNRVIDLPERELSNVRRLSAALEKDIVALDDSKRRYRVVVAERRALGGP